MYRLSGRDISKAAYAHLHQVNIVAHLASGQELTLASSAMPALIDGTINFVSDGVIKRRCALAFETQTPSQRFLHMINDDQTRYMVYLGIDTLEPMGVYFLRDLSIDDPGQNRNYRLSLQDEASLMAERKTTVARSYSGDVITVVEAILNGTGRTLYFTGTRYMGISLTNYFVDIDKDPISTAAALLDGYGYEVLMGLTGDCIIRQIPGEPSNVKSKNIDTIVLAQQIVRARRGTNHVIVLGESGARGDAYDLDPSSPTYVYSRYGDVPVTYTVKGLLSNPQCQRAADSLAARLFQRQATHTYSCLQTPRLDLGDGYTTHGFKYTADQLAYSLVANRPMYLTGRGVSV